MEASEPKVVLSAVRGVTDELIRQANLAKDGGFDLSGIDAMHLSLVKALPADVRVDVALQVGVLLDELNDKMAHVLNQGELTLPALDDLVVYGEKLATAVALGYLAEKGLHAMSLSGGEAGILTDGVFGNASIVDESYAAVRRRLGPVHLPIVAGFYGTDKAGNVTTLGRGASDYVAAFIATALGCKVVLFKDVDGVMTADPKVVPRARLIPKLDYQTALEMTRFGSKVLFEKAVIQASKARIRIEVVSFDKANEGTVVSESGEGVGVSYARSLSLVDAAHLSSFRTASLVLSKLDESYGWNPPVFASMFRNGLVIAVGDSQVEAVSAMVTSAGVGAISIRNAVAVVSITGRSIKVSDVMVVIRTAQIEPLGVFRTPSGMTTCLLVDAMETETAVKALHTLIEIRQPEVPRASPGSQR